MRRDLERRLRNLEIANAEPSALQIWVIDDDGTICGPCGERITRDAFDHQQRGRRGVILLSATDARL
jgi:hypothetical protein